MISEIDLDFEERWLDDEAINLPSHMIGSVKRYVLRGIGGGSFLTALFSNDLIGAIGKADAENQEAIGAWAQFLYNSIPGNCHGSPEKVAAWIASGGIAGSRVES